MKKLFAIGATVMFLLTGCTNKSNETVTEPEQAVTVDDLKFKDAEDVVKGYISVCLIKGGYQPKEIDIQVIGIYEDNIIFTIKSVTLEDGRTEEGDAEEWFTLSADYVNDLFDFE